MEKQPQEYRDDSTKPTINIPGNSGEVGIKGRNDGDESLSDIERKIEEIDLLPLEPGKSLGEQIDRNKLVDPKVVDWLLEVLTDYGNEMYAAIPEHWQQYIPDGFKSYRSVIDRKKVYGVFAIDLDNPKVLNGFKVSYGQDPGKMQLLEFIGAASETRHLRYEPVLSKARLELDTDVFEKIVGKGWDSDNYILVKK